MSGTLTLPRLEQERVVIIGCGFAGLKLARTLDSRQYQTVVFDRNNYHTFQPLMYQVATAGLEPDSIVYPIRKVFRKKQRFHFRMAEVGRIDADAKVVHTSIGAVSYDKLVLAGGATTNFFGLERIEKHALPMKTLVESLNIRSVVLQHFEQALNTNDLAEREALMSFVIVGGGPTGVELAGALAELKKHVLPNDYPDLDLRLMQIHLVEGSDRVLAAMSEHASAKADKFLRSMDVNVWTGLRVRDYDGLNVDAGEHHFKARNLIWSAGVKGEEMPGLVAEVAPDGRISVDGEAKVIGYDNIYCIGDLARMASEQEPRGHAMLASVASQQGKWLGQNLNRAAKGGAPKPFKYNDKGTMATIGRNRAVVDLPNWKFSGMFAWMTWMLVHLLLLVDFRSRLVVLVNWAWSYINYDRGTRLIVRKIKRPAPEPQAESEVVAVE